jgi:uncharacterized membrane protein YbhN (UPF0104 family)
MRALQLLVSAGLFVACLLAVDARAVVSELSDIEPRWVLAAFALHLVQLALLACRWTVVARALGLPLDFWRALGEYALSVFVNQVVPGGLAGDGMRALRHARRSESTSVLRAVEALAVDRASGQVAYWFCVALTAPLAVTQQIVEPGVLGGVVLGTAALVAGSWYALERFAPETGLFGRARRSLRRVAWVLLHPRQVAAHLPLSFAFVAVTLLQFHVAALAIGAPLEFSQLVWIGPLILSASSIPSFGGGWGVREGASAVLFGAAGLSGSLGVAVSVVYGVFGLVVSTLGLGVWWLVERLRQKPASMAA